MLYTQDRNSIRKTITLKELIIQLFTIKALYRFLLQTSLNQVDYSKRILFYNAIYINRSINSRNTRLAKDENSSIRKPYEYQLDSFLKDQKSYY